MEVILRGTLEHGPYKFILHKSPSPSSISVKNSSAASVSPTSPDALPSVFTSSCNVASSLDLWHKRLGHCAYPIVKKILLKCNLPSTSMKSDFLCDSCCIAKSHKLPYSPSLTQYTAPLELIHSDLWGPAPITSRNGFRYYVNFVDQYSRFTWFYLLKTKNELLSVFQHFKNFVEN